MAIHLSKLLKLYKRPEIQKEIYFNAKDREVAIKLEKGFGKRPDSIQYPRDILAFAQQKATSFHLSEERWKNPLQLGTNLAQKDLNALRRGWDLVLDIDGLFEFSIIVAHLVVQFLKSYGIKAVSCKFSGNKGFHIGVPFESFPKEVNGVKVEELFPEAPRRIAAFIWSKIEKKLAEEMVKEYPIETLQTMIDKPFDKITKKVNGETILNPSAFVDIDTVLISSRHLYRSAYSFNEKSGLVSVPINPDRVLKFSKIEGKPENVRVSKFRFLDDALSTPGEANKLFKAAFDFTFNEEAIVKKEYEEKTREFSQTRKFDADELAEAIPEEHFPPCIKLILAGIADGKKRSLFILTNFLTSVGWEFEDIEKLLEKWNKNNNPQLKEGMIKNHLRYNKNNKKKVLPPNCDNEGYYLNIGVCKPDNLCARIKNPAQYAKAKFRNAGKNDKKTKKKVKK